MSSSGNEYSKCKRCGSVEPVQTCGVYCETCRSRIAFLYEQYTEGSA